MTFTLAGFSTLKREVFTLPSNFTATVNADMNVGAIDETITVTGEAPMVDIQSTRQQTQFQRETLEAIPTTGRLTGLSQVIPGTTLLQPAQHSVGGVNDSAQFTFTLHGAPMAEPVVDGMSQVIGITNGVFVFNQATFAEVVIETSGVGADRDTGGMQLNIIQRDGGNQFSGGLGFSYSGPSLRVRQHHRRAGGPQPVAQQCRRAQEVPRHHTVVRGAHRAGPSLVFRGRQRRREPAASAGQLLQQAPGHDSALLRAGSQPSSRDQSVLKRSHRARDLAGGPEAQGDRGGHRLSRTAIACSVC